MLLHCLWPEMNALIECFVLHHYIFVLVVTIAVVVYISRFESHVGGRKNSDFFFLHLNIVSFVFTCTLNRGN